MTKSLKSAIDPDINEILDQTVDLRRHLRQHIGPVYKFQAGPESLSGNKIGACVFSPDEYKPYWTVCSVGISNISRSYAPARDTFTELILSLPADWDWSDVNNSWPLTLLWTLAELVGSKKNKSFINGQVIRAKGASIPIFSRSASPAGGVCFKNPTLLAELAWQLESDRGIVNWLGVVPLFMNEIDFVEKHGESEVFDKLAELEISELFNRRRINTCL